MDRAVNPFAARNKQIALWSIWLMSGDSFARNWIVFLFMGESPSMAVRMIYHASAHIRIAWRIACHIYSDNEMLQGRRDIIPLQPKPISKIVLTWLFNEFSLILFILKKCFWGATQRLSRNRTEPDVSESRISRYWHQTTNLQSQWNPAKFLDDR
jgi:hypothetical protein